jgi:hypothetical protein
LRTGRVTIAAVIARKGEETDVVSHKIGDIVTINPAINRFGPGGVFEVIKQLPGGDEPEYRIKSANERHEHAARESELVKA